MPSITAERLNQLLDQDSWPRVDHVQVADDQVVDEVVRIIAYVPATLEYFAGHFPEQAVLPGVVQVHWVGELAQLFFGVNDFHDLKSIKFSNMILPEQTIRLELKYSPLKGSVRFSYVNAEDQNERLSSGMLSFALVSDETQHA